jgi:ketosteroid isomerase-like protein
VRWRLFKSRQEALEAAELGGLAASANLGLGRSIYADWERGDFSSTEWLILTSSSCSSAAFWTAAGPDWLEWRKASGWRTAWEELRIEVDEYRALDKERVLVLYHRSGRGKTSGLDLAQFRSDGAALLRVGNGKVTSLVSYADRDRALADLGLAPEASSSDS